MHYIIANWKAHKTLEEALSWTDAFLSLLSKDSELTGKLTHKGRTFNNSYPTITIGRVNTRKGEREAGNRRWRTGRI